MTRDELRRLIENRPCKECGLGRQAGAHMAYREARSCSFRLDVERLVDRIMEEIARC